MLDVIPRIVSPLEGTTMAESSLAVGGGAVEAWLLDSFDGWW